MSADQLRRIISEGQPGWFEQPARKAATADEIVALLDTQSYFELYGLPYPTSREGVLARLAQERLIVERSSGWEVSNLAAILLAKRLDAFSPELARKAPRVVIYEGINKLATREDKVGGRGYRFAGDRRRQGRRAGQGGRIGQHVDSLCPVPSVLGLKSPLTQNRKPPVPQNKSIKISAISALTQNQVPIGSPKSSPMGSSIDVCHASGRPRAAIGRF
jgi:hypothetical protein